MERKDSNEGENIVPVPESDPPSMDVPLGIGSGVAGIPNAQTGVRRNPLDASTPREFLTASIELLEDTLAEAHDEIREHIRRLLNESQEALQNSRSEISTGIITPIMESESLSTKAEKAIRKSIEAKLIEAYGIGESMGIPQPSMPQVLYGLDTGDALLSNFLGEVGGQPYIITWPEELLGPRPSLTATQQTSTAMDAFVGEPSTDPNNPPPNNDCPPGFIPAVLPDGTIECNPPEYAYPPNGNGNPPPYIPPLPPFGPPPSNPNITMPRNGWYCIGTESVEIHASGQLDNQGRPIGIATGVWSGKFAQCWAQHAPVWDANAPMVWVVHDPPHGVTFPSFPQWCGERREDCKLLGCDPEIKPPPSNGTPPPNGQSPLPTTEICPIDPPKIKCKPGDVLYACVQPLADRLDKDYRYNKKLPADLQVIVDALEPDQLAISKAIWQWATDKCAKDKGIKNADEYAMICGFDRYKPINWCSPVASESVDAFAFSLPQNAQDFAKSFCVWQFADKSWYPNTATKWLYDLKLVPDVVPDSINELLYGILTGVYETITSISDPSNPRSKPSLVADGIYSVAKVLNRITGFPPDSWIKRMEYTTNALAPVQIPSPGEINELVLTDEIDVSTYRNMIGAHDLCPDLMEMVVHARRSRPDIFQVISLYLRKDIDDLEFRDRMRKLGVIDPQDLTRFLTLAEQIPPVSDIIRFMTRDAADPEVINTYNLLDEFESKYQGQLKEWGEGQGIPEELMKAEWTSHWVWPSNTQLYLMLQQLNEETIPDKPELWVSQEDILKVLGINDVAPYWRERLVAISYNPLTRTDVKRAYNIDVLTKDDVYRAYRKNGYDPTNAKTLTEFADVEKKQYVRGQLGLPRAKDYVSEYINGRMSEASVRGRLSDMGWGIERQDQAIIGANEKRRLNSIKFDLTSLKKAFMRFRLDEPETRGQMVDLDLDADTIDYNISMWVRERLSKYKTISQAQACEMAQRGIVDGSGYLNLLSRLGFGNDDIRRISNLCYAKGNEKSAREGQREQRRIQAENEKIIKQAEAAAEKKRKAAEKAQAKRDACKPKKQRCEELGVPQEETPKKEETKEEPQEGTDSQS